MRFYLQHNQKQYYQIDFGPLKKQPITYIQWSIFSTNLNNWQPSDHQCLAVIYYQRAKIVCSKVQKEENIHWSFEREFFNQKMGKTLVLCFTLKAAATKQRSRVANAWNTAGVALSPVLLLDAIIFPHMNLWTRWQFQFESNCVKKKTRKRGCFTCVFYCFYVNLTAAVCNPFPRNISPREK